jgi:rhamnose utilization protein RhaD (predicted bifunctional aldolase and dehydrogenase)
MGQVLGVGFEKPAGDQPDPLANVSHLPGATEIDRLVARSRAIGADPTLVVHGGGNTSTKTRERDHLGRERDVLRIKGSGTDLKTIGPDGFPGLFLDELLPLRERAAMSDEEMVDYLAHCMVEPGSRRPSIETLLHAFLPARHVDHVHADAICALTNNAEPARHVRAALGDDVAVVPYVRPGFDLSRQVAALAGARAVVLAKHGLVTWGDTHEASYGLTLALVEAAKSYLTQRLPRQEEPRQPDLSDAERRRLLSTLRGRLSRQQRCVLAVDQSQRTFSDRRDVQVVGTAGRATPDHILRIGAWSAVVRGANEVDAVIEDFERGYFAYFARHRNRVPSGVEMLSPLPRVFLVPGLGTIATGTDAKIARANAEIAYRSHRVSAMTNEAFGRMAWLTEDEVFDFDYWPLELAKLATAPAPRILAGYVAIVLAMDTPYADAIVARLARDGAHLIVAGRDEQSSEATISGLPAGTAFTARPENAVSTAVDSFGGVDVLIAGEAIPEMVLAEMAATVDAQRLGGTVAVIDANLKPELLKSIASFGPDLRVNGVQLCDGVEPERLAEAVAFLVSPRAMGMHRVILPVA